MPQRRCLDDISPRYVREYADLGTSFVSANVGRMEEEEAGEE